MDLSEAKFHHSLQKMHLSHSPYCTQLRPSKIQKHTSRTEFRFQSLKFLSCSECVKLHPKMVKCFLPQNRRGKRTAARIRPEVSHCSILTVPRTSHPHNLSPYGSVSILSSSQLLSLVKWTLPAAFPQNSHSKSFKWLFQEVSY